MMTTEMMYSIYKSGLRVRVVKNRSYKKHDYTGYTGTIVRNQYASFGNIIVALDNVVNPYGQSGHFYFKPHELAIINSLDINILEDNNMEPVVNYFNIVKIQYLNSDKPSDYQYANFDPELKGGDLCVVKSLNHGLGLARVIEVIDQNDVKTVREIVAKVNTTDYDFRVKARKDVAELKAKMEARAKELQDIALYRLLAEKDSSMKELLDSYTNLPLF